MNPEPEKKTSLLDFEQKPANLYNTFESFIEGERNRMARSCAFAIAEKPGDTMYNPFIVYSPIGFGKTHLIQAVFNKIIIERPEIKTLYIDSLTFIQQFTQSVINNRKEDFFNFYCSSDFLIIDDIQCLSGKEKTQQALLSIFDQLYHARRQIVMATSILPKNLEGFLPGLISRFGYGLTVCINKPDYETRLEILKKNVRHLDIHIKDSILEMLALKVDSDVRSLEGTLIVLLANASVSNREIDLDFAKTTIDKLFNQKKKEEIK